MPKRTLQGIVVSNKADKTVTVRVERRIMHPVYKKFITKSKSFAAHDEENRARKATQCVFVNALQYPSQRPLKWSMTPRVKVRRF